MAFLRTGSGSGTLDVTQLAAQREQEMVQRWRWQREQEGPLEKVVGGVLNRLLPDAPAMAARADIVAVLTQAIRAEFRAGRLIPFGSYEMGLSSNTSDLDLSMEVSPPPSLAPSFAVGMMAEPRTRDAKIAVLRRVAAVIRRMERAGQVERVEVVFRAIVPVVKFVHSRSLVECDISVANRDGFFKSRFIRFVSSIDPRFKHLCFLVKAWARNEAINDPRNGTLNSLALILLCALHLQTRSPPILPPFKDIMGPFPEPLTSGRDAVPLPEQELMDRLAHAEGRAAQMAEQGYGKRNTESLPHLLASFFVQMAAQEDLWAHTLCASVYEGRWIPRDFPQENHVTVMARTFTTGHPTVRTPFAPRSSPSSQPHSPFSPLALFFPPRPLTSCPPQIEDFYHRSSNCARTVRPKEFITISAAFSRAAQAVMDAPCPPPSLSSSSSLVDLLFGFSPVDLEDSGLGWNGDRFAGRGAGMQVGGRQGRWDEDRWNGGERGIGAGAAEERGVGDRWRGVVEEEEEDWRTRPVSDYVSRESTGRKVARTSDYHRSANMHRSDNHHVPAAASAAPLQGAWAMRHAPTHEHHTPNLGTFRPLATTPPAPHESVGHIAARSYAIPHNLPAGAVLLQHHVVAARPGGGYLTSQQTLQHGQLQQQQQQQQQAARYGQQLPFPMHLQQSVPVQQSIQFRQQLGALPMQVLAAQGALAPPLDHRGRYTRQ
ncbi:unnamed protein product [Closterium sp. Naga37s-1]|nr:unnamed protein product [Closterium sp. Naga37s-1]